jgi:hypothetical protein
MISYGANNWNDGLYGACMYDNFEIATLMVSYGANECGACTQINNHKKIEFV